MACTHINITFIMKGMYTGTLLEDTLYHHSLNRVIYKSFYDLYITLFTFLQYTII